LLFRDKYGKSKIPLLKSRLFWFGLIIKVGLSCLFASGYLTQLFAPFGNYFIESGFQNPYEHFQNNGTGTEFPYPPLMLWLFTLPRTILWPIIGGSSTVFSFADSIIYRIPLLLADLAILFVLLRWLKTKMRQVLVWYWLSPILIYINYFHGQLDVIPIAVLFISLYFLFKNKFVLSFLVLGLAIGCKTNIVLVFPFYVIYLFRISHINFKDIALSVSTFFITVALINLPFINSPGFIKMVYNNPVQQHIFDLYYVFNETLKIYFIPAVYFSLLIWYLSMKFVNRDQLILFFAFTFLALTLMVAPMQGWYYWIMPFLIYFSIKQDKVERQLLILLTFFYFAYFALAPNSDYHNSFNFASAENDSPFAFLRNTKLPDIIFTLMQTTLLFIGFLVFRKGLANNIQAKFLSQPYMIGIGGDSAAGKSTLTLALTSVFETHNTSVIRGDDMHKWERGDENWNNFTHLDPRANKLHEDMDQAMRLKTGKGVKRSFYDHHTGKFTLPKFIRPNKLIIFEGLHSFYLKNQADVYDLKIFMDPEENLRVWWKVKRDVAARGYTPEQVLEQLKKREEDSINYIRSQASEVDVAVSFFSDKPLDPTRLDVEPELALKLTFFNNTNLDPLLEKLSKSQELKVEINYVGNQLVVTIRGKITSHYLEQIAYRLIPELEEVGVYNAVWKNDYEGILQLVTVYLVFGGIKNSLS